MCAVHFDLLFIGFFVNNAAKELHVLTPEQAEDFQAFLKQIAGLTG